MIQVSVKSTEVRHQSGKAKATGKDYDLSFQVAYFHTFDKSGRPNPFPEKVEIILDKNEQGAPLYYPEGEYTLSPSSVYVDRGGNLAIRPRLVPLQKKPVAAS